DHGETAEAGEYLEQALLQGQLAEERQAQPDVVLRQRIELLSARLLLLKGYDLAQTLHGIDREGAEFARRFARLRTQSVYALAHHEGAHADGGEKWSKGQRDPRTLHSQYRQHCGRDQNGNE